EKLSIETAFDNDAKVHCYLVCCIACARGGTFACPVTGSGLSSDRSNEGTSGSARFSGGAHSPLSGPIAGPDPGGVHLSPRAHPAPAVAGKEQKSEGQSARQGGGETVLGPKHPSHGRSSRCGQATGGRYSVDHR